MFYDPAPLRKQGTDWINAQMITETCTNQFIPTSLMSMMSVCQYLITDLKDLKEMKC